MKYFMILKKKTIISAHIAPIWGMFRNELNRINENQKLRPWLHSVSMHIQLRCANPIGAPVLPSFSPYVFLASDNHCKSMLLYV